MEIRPIFYNLTVHCVRQGVGIVAEFYALSAFPNYSKGGHLNLPDCLPRTWDITDTIQQIRITPEGNIMCESVILVDSPVLNNTGQQIVKQNGETISLYFAGQESNS